MKITRTQPLEEATPVVPETQATVEPAAPATPTAAGGARDHNDGHDRPPDQPPDEPDAYPEPPAGSGGHP